MKDLSLHTPWALLLVLLVAAVYAERWWWRSRGRAPALRYSAVTLTDGVPTTWAVRLAWLPEAIRALSLVCLVVALARPQLVGTPEAEETEGIDITLVLDTSCSMSAADFQPQDRMFVAKKSIGEFVKKRTSDRISLVVFGGEAATWVPLTLDYSLVMEMLEEIEVGMVEDGTAIGNAIGTGLNRLRASEAKSKVMILLTDGDSNAGEISPMAAAELAQQMGVKVYTILIGQGGAVPFPAGKDLFGRPVFRKTVIPTNPELLEKIAKITQGEAFKATDKDELDARLSDVLDALDRSRLESTAQARPYAELFPWAVGAALLLMALEVALGATRLRRFP